MMDQPSMLELVEVVRDFIKAVQENKQSLASQLHAADGALPAQLGAAEVEALFE